VGTAQVAVTMMAVVIPTAALWAAGGGAVARILIGGRASRPMSVALAFWCPRRSSRCGLTPNDGPWSSFLGIEASEHDIVPRRWKLGGLVLRGYGAKGLPPPRIAPEYSIASTATRL
jgi:hypothetical protein